MSILIDKVRIKNFRSLKDTEIDLQPITILVGANNSGKTTFLRALNAVLGTSRTSLNRDDLFIDKDGNQPENEIIIDVRIVPVDENGRRKPKFEDNEYGLFGGELNIISEEAEPYPNYEYYAFRCVFQFNAQDNPEKPSVKRFSNWENINVSEDDEVSLNSLREGLNLFFLDAQRDLNDDIKQRNSFFGKQTVEIKENDALKALEPQVNQINEDIIAQSEVLRNLRSELSKLNSTIQNSGDGIVIKPLNSNIRDIHKGMRVEYQDNGSASFGMEYHGMGTRSWASILSFGAYVNQEAIKRKNTERAYLPILALEEPEAHLHPNAQRTLYQQLEKFQGQKIVSTHSPYIAGQAELEELRYFDKKSDNTEINFLNTDLLNSDEKRKIRNEVVKSNGEILFSRCIVLFEGETEKQCLPIFAEKYFGNPIFHYGISFISVNGNNYRPFIILAQKLGIYWFIFSDYDNGNIKKGVDNALRQIGYTNPETTDIENVIKLSNPIEKYLIGEGYQQQLKNGINNWYLTTTDESTDVRQIEAGQNRVNEYTDVNLLKDISSDDGKVRYPYYWASEIINLSNEKNIPPKIKELFDKIAQKLNINDNHETTTL